MTSGTGQAVIATGTLQGVEARSVEVQVDVGRGLPSFTIVGLGDTAVHEARERVRAAVRTSGLDFPQGRITVNLAPAPLRKHGTGFDLPIAIGILTATGQLPAGCVDGCWCTGELALDGRVMAVRGTMAHALASQAAGLTLLSAEEAEIEARAVSGLRWRPVGHLRDVSTPRVDSDSCPGIAESAETANRLHEVAGHESAKRALLIAAAGALNILMIGPPGTGKTLLARALPGILPPLSPSEAVETALSHSVAGLDPAPCLGRTRPFRAPHHSATLVGLVGGGSPLRPGEVSLAHNGVLFLDEMTEFGPATLQALRQPLEDGYVTLVRADGRTRLPARFMLAGAANPCPCGYLGDPVKHCTCSESAISRYASRIGGPLLDRIDLAVRMNRVDPGLVVRGATQSDDANSRGRVLSARRRADTRGTPVNGLSGAELLHVCALKSGDVRLVEDIARRSGLSGRGVTRILRVARVIADLDNEECVTSTHLHEASTYRVEEVCNR